MSPVNVPYRASQAYGPWQYIYLLFLRTIGICKIGPLQPPKSRHSNFASGALTKASDCDASPRPRTSEKMSSWNEGRKPLTTAEEADSDADVWLGSTVLLPKHSRRVQQRFFPVVSR